MSLDTSWFQMEPRYGDVVPSPEEEKEVQGLGSCSEVLKPPILCSRRASCGEAVHEPYLGVELCDRLQLCGIWVTGHFGEGRSVLLVLCLLLQGSMLQGSSQGRAAFLARQSRPRSQAGPEWRQTCPINPAYISGRVWNVNTHASRHKATTKCWVLKRNFLLSTFFPIFRWWELCSDVGDTDLVQDRMLAWTQCCFQLGWQFHGLLASKMPLCWAEDFDV